MSDNNLSVFEIQELLVCGKLLLKVLEEKYEPTLEEKERLIEYLNMCDKLDKKLKGGKP